MAASMKTSIVNFVAGTSDDAYKEIANEINKKKYKFLEFVEDLGESLTNVDTVARGRATRLIGDVLQLLPPSFLSNDQVELVATFLIAKLSDHHSVQPHALQTLAVLTSRTSSLPIGLPQLISTSIFREVQNQSLSQNDRFATYTILQNILGSSFKAVQDMGGDFVIGFIQQMDSEKDPRNLMIAFNCAQYISSNLSLGAFVEEMFEVLGCYFPIDFTPPSNDKHRITKEELVLALRKCFSATPDFAPFCVPLLLEKMASDLQSARLDAFQTLKQCAPVYGRNGIYEFVGSIVSCVKREVLMNLSNDLVENAKACLSDVFSALSPEEDVNISKDDTITTPAVELYQDVCKFLEGSDITKSCLAFSLCSSVAESSFLSFCTMAPLILPQLVQQIDRQNQNSVQLLYLTELNAIITLIDKFKSNQMVLDCVSNSITPICDVLVKLMSTDTPELQLKAAQSLASLCKTEEVQEEKCVSYLKLIITLGMNAKDESHRKDFLSVVQEILKCRSNARSTIAEFIKDAINSGVYSSAMALVATVSDLESFTDVNDFLLNCLSQKWSDSAVSSLCCLRDLVSSYVSKPELAAAMFDITVCPVVKTVLTHSSNWCDQDLELATAFLNEAGKIMEILAASLPKGCITKFWDALQKLFLLNDQQGFGLSNDTSLKLLKFDSSWQDMRLIALLEGFVKGVNIQWAIDQREAIFETTFGFALACEDHYSHLSACKIVAAILNKAPIGSQIHWFLEPVMEKTSAAMTNDQGTKESHIRALDMWTWLTKATESRSHSTAGAFTLKLVSLVSDPNLGLNAALGMGHVVAPGDDMFTPPYHGNTSPLYRQRFFTLNLKHLLRGFQKGKSEDIKHNHQTAISLMTSHLPLQVIKPQLNKLVPVLLSCLKSSDHQMLCHTLKTLSAAVTSAPDEFIPHLETVIHRLLDISKHNSAMKMRLAALECLESLTSLSLLSIGPWETYVVKELGVVLDDKKRVVRQQAVGTRNAWIMLSTNIKS